MNKQNSQPKFPEQIKNVPSLTKNPMMDMFLTYQFLKRIVIPFEKSDAYKIGIIDKNGKVLKKKSTLKTDQEKAAWGYFDILTNNLKKLLAKVPGGNSILGSSVASYLLIKEHRSELLLNEVYFETQFMKVYNQLAEEGEVPANNVGSGNVKTFDPLLILKAKNMLRRRKPFPSKVQEQNNRVEVIKPGTEPEKDDEFPNYGKMKFNRIINGKSVPVDRYSKDYDDLYRSATNREPPPGREMFDALKDIIKKREENPPPKGKVIPERPPRQPQDKIEKPNYKLVPVPKDTMISRSDKKKNNVDSKLST